MTAILGWAAAVVIAVWSAYELWHRRREHRAELGGEVDNGSRLADQLCVALADARRLLADLDEAQVKDDRLTAERDQLRAALATARADIAMADRVIHGRLLHLADQGAMRDLLDEVLRQKRDVAVVTRLAPDGELESAPQVYIGEITGQHPMPALEERS